MPRPYLSFQVRVDGECGRRSRTLDATNRLDSGRFQIAGEVPRTSWRRARPAPAPLAARGILRRAYRSTLRSARLITALSSVVMSRPSFSRAYRSPAASACCGVVFGQSGGDPSHVRVACWASMLVLTRQRRSIYANSSRPSHHGPAWAAAGPSPPVQGVRRVTTCPR